MPYPWIPPTGSGAPPALWVPRLHLPPPPHGQLPVWASESCDSELWQVTSEHVQIPSSIKSVGQGETTNFCFSAAHQKAKESSQDLA